MNKINILAIDDQDDVLDAIASWSNHYDEIGEVRVAQNKSQYDELLAKYRKNTDVIMMDLMLDTNIAISSRKRYSSTDLFSGFKLLKESLETYPDLNIVIYSQFFNHTTVIECYKLGAKGFIPKGSWPNEVIIKYLLDAANGDVFHPSEYETLLISKLVAYKNETLSKLTEREISILALLVSRNSTEHIVSELKLPSEQVLYNYVARIIGKLEIEPEKVDGRVTKKKREILIEIGEKAGLRK